METPGAREALERLKLGNERFRTDRARGEGRTSARREQLIGEQRPFAVVLGCADSRVPPEILFDTGLGDLFVVRVAGNVANSSSIASIEYALANLGSKLVVVMAHQSCGAVGGAIAGGNAGKHLDHLFSLIQPAIEAPDADSVARRSARLQAARLIDESSIIRRAVETEGVEIVTAFYRFSDGAVEFHGR